MILVAIDIAVVIAVVIAAVIVVVTAVVVEMVQNESYCCCLKGCLPWMPCDPFSFSVGSLLLLLAFHCCY